ncbi:MAG TPA: DNA mismatch repair endonuclease MutL [Candidatus Dormibacteraeota bacterium]
MPPEVANAIAAGEVIDRPASVVKELIENSLDAGARAISVEIEGGGSRLIRVVDDGRGIAPGALALAFQRHATSKLREIADLSRVATFGFRGEALASIAAVAKVVAISRQPGARAGAQVTVAANLVEGPIPTGAAPGTVIEVRELFHNTPARLAFLRSERSESSACLRVLADAALGRPDVRYDARVGGRRALSSPGAGDLALAARAVLGRSAGTNLLPVDWSEGGLSVTGILGPPGPGWATRANLLLMVNGRRVHQRALVAAIEGAYQGLLEVGRHPLAVLDVRCDLREVDVNVHPTKREVRFRDEARAFEAVQRACWGTLHQLGPAGMDLGAQPGGDPVWVRSDWSRSDVLSGWEHQGDLLADEVAIGEPDHPLAGAADWRYLGQAHNRYLVVETERGIGLLDQHAAHEKVVYARVVASLGGRSESGARPSQGLLTPLLLEVGPLAIAGLAERGELLARAGFEVEQFGEATVRCSAVPIGTVLSRLSDLLLELLAPANDLTDAARAHRMAAAIACHTAIRFGDPVSRDEVARLLQDLARTPGGVTCPHGRPSILLLSETQLLGAFRRHA